VEARILSVLSDSKLGEQVRAELFGEGYLVVVAESIDEGRQQLACGPWDVVLGDVSGELGGEELLAAVLSVDLLSQVVFYSSFVTVPEAVSLMRMGAWSVLLADDSGAKGLVSAVKEAWSERRADLELAKEHGID
jgi:DNA-binding NtrC family response regulator